MNLRVLNLDSGTVDTGTRWDPWSSPPWPPTAPARRVMTDNAFACRLSEDFQGILAGLDARHILIKPGHPWQNGKAERFNRTLQERWACRQVFDSSQA